MEQGAPQINYTILTTTCLEQNEMIITPVDTGGSGGGGGSMPGGTTPPPNNPPCTGTTIPTNPQPGFTDENGCPIGAPSLPNYPTRNTPCADLNNKSIDNDFLGKMQELSNDANGIAEAGITMYNTSPKYGNKKYGAVDSNGGSFVELEVDWSKAPDITGFMHCHLNNLNVIKTYTVFSSSDFIALAQLVENSTAPVHTLGMYVTTNRGTFAIKLTNKQVSLIFQIISRIILRIWKSFMRLKLSGV